MDGVFDLDLPAPVVKRPRHEPVGKIAWAKYRPANPVHCDDCLAEMHEQWPTTMQPNRALFKRTAGAKVVFLCALHATAQREKDGLVPARKRGARDL